MIFEPGKTNLRDIHEFMTQIDTIRLEMENSRIAHNAVIKERLIQLVNKSNPDKPYSEKTTYTLFTIENDINQLRSEIGTYKHNLLLSKIFFLEFKQLKANYLR